MPIDEFIYCPSTGGYIYGSSAGGYIPWPPYGWVDSSILTRGIIVVPFAVDCGPRGGACIIGGCIIPRGGLIIGGCIPYDDDGGCIPYDEDGGCMAWDDYIPCGG